MAEHYSSGAPARQPVIGVIGSGRTEHAELAVPLGEWIARRGYHLLTGGGGGVMAAVSRGFASVEGRRGIAIGVLPGDPAGAGVPAPPGYPNPWVELVLRTHLPCRGEEGMDPRSRNPINVLSADAVIALPGGAGTRSEVALALRYGRPVVAFLGERGEITGFDAARIDGARTLEEVERFVVGALGARAII